MWLINVTGTMTVTRITLAVIVSILLFYVAFFMVILPGMEKSLLHKRMETTQELVRAGWHILSLLEARERRGDLTRREAQDEAVALIGALRYGAELKDYFWIHDMQPRMIMHPYRRDLEGRDVAKLSDPDGRNIIQDSVDAVKDKGEGFIGYVWQWKDDSRKIAPKISYVKGFSAWEWVIGTGIYIDDVKHDISRTTREFVMVSFWIIVVIAALLGYIIQLAKREECIRAKAEDELRRSHQNLEDKVSARTTALNEINQKITEQHNQKKELLHMLCHDLTNPVGAAKNLIELAISKRNDGGALEWLQLSRKGLIQSLDIIGLTRKMMAIDESKLELSIRTVGLKDMIDSSTQMLCDRFKQKDIDLVVDVAADITVSVEPVSFVNSVMNNLLTNAVKFSQAGSAILVKANRVDGWVVVTVQDFGIGLPESLLNRIFDPSARTNRLGTAGESGTGFGMPLAKKLTEAYGGMITIESTEKAGLNLQSGTTITIHLRH